MVLRLFVRHLQGDTATATNLPRIVTDQLHSTSDSTFWQSKTWRTQFANGYWRMTLFVCCSSHSKQFTLRHSLSWKHRHFPHQTKDWPVSRHFVIYRPATSLLIHFVKHCIWALKFSARLARGLEVRGRLPCVLQWRILWGIGASFPHELSPALQKQKVIFIEINCTSPWKLNSDLYTLTEKKSSCLPAVSDIHSCVVNNGSSLQFCALSLYTGWKTIGWLCMNQSKGRLTIKNAPVYIGALFCYIVAALTGLPRSEKM